MANKTAEEIQEILKNYNLNDGVEEVVGLLDEPGCEFGNALFFYWLMEGVFYYSERYEGHKYRDLLMKIERRLLSGFYRKERIHYLPVIDYYLFKTQVYLLKKKGIPKELIEPDYNCK
jgi:hypothetical protein